MKKKVLGILIAVLIISALSLNLTNASYIKADFNIDKSGSVIVNGDTDANPNINGISKNGTKLTGSTSELTSKIKDIWKFELNLDYTDTDVKISLPTDSNIFNIETDNPYTISSDLGKITLEVNDSKPVNIIFYYSVGLSLTRTDFLAYLPYLFIAAIIINGAVIYYLNRKLKEKPKTIYRKVEKKVDKIKILAETLNEKEKLVLNAIEKGADYQAKIMKETLIPKASLSRYINNLIKKGFLIKKGEGKLAKIMLKNK